MKPVILPMAYRRFRHSVHRSALAERTLLKMKHIDDPINAETSEVVTHRFPSVVIDNNNKAILAHSLNLSNRSVITV